MTKSSKEKRSTSIVGERNENSAFRDGKKFGEVACGNLGAVVVGDEVKR